MKQGWILTGKQNKRWVKCEMVAGPYEFRHAVKLRIGQHEVITEASSFVEQRPDTEFQVRRKQKRATLATARALWVKIVLNALADGPKNIGELHKATGFWYGPIYMRIAYWKEFENVWRNEGKYEIVDKKKKEMLIRMNKPVEKL